MTNRVITGLTMFLISVLLAACSSVRPPPPPPDFGKLAENWILLPEPISGEGTDLLGTAYSIRDGERFQRCYEFQPGSVLSSFDTIHLSWDQSKSGTAFFKVANLLGLDASAKRMARGVIQLDSVRIVEVTSVSPAAGSDCVLTSPADGLPMFPAMRALVGAKSFTFAAWNQQGVSVTGDFAKDGPSVGFAFQQQRGDSTLFSFRDLRWIGAQFVGFNAAPTTQPRTFALALGLPGTVEVLPEGAATKQRFRVTVEAHPDGFKVSTQRTSRITMDEIVREGLAAGESFHLERLSDAQQVGRFLMASVEALSADSVRFKVWSQGVDRETFVGEEERGKLFDWIAERQRR